MTRAEAVRTRLRASLRSGGLLVGAAIGTGLAAQAATRGGADFLLALSAGRIRLMGEPSIASLLPLRDTNRFVPEFAIAEIRPRTDRPLFIGVACFDPRLDTEAYLAEIEAAGFDGVTNFPTVALVDGRYRRFLEASGFGFGREIALLAAARVRGLATLAYVHTREEAREACAAGVDVINIDLGWNTGGTLGVETAMRLEQASELARTTAQIVRRKAPGTLVVLEGGPIVSPEQADEVCRAAAVDGYVGGSTIDRVPLETAIELVTSSFKTVGALRRKVSSLERRIAPRRCPAMLLGSAPSAVRARGALDQALAAELPVLIRGEPGMGRRDLARTLHASGLRRARRIGWVSFGAGLGTAEVELFGCEANAAPGISRQRIGWLELARGSTLVLDGVERMDRITQSRLCAAIESGSFRRVGSTQQVSLDVWLIGISTPRDPARPEGRLTELLGPVCIDIPPIRDHLEDLPQIILATLEDAAQSGSRKAPLLHPASFRVLLSHSWPGNLREIRSVLQHAAALAGPEGIMPEHLPPLHPVPVQRGTGGVNEREWILDALRRNRFRRGEAARFLGVSRKTLYNRMLALGLLTPSEPPATPSRATFPAAS
jgi:predicted TIM-barrel enzyme/DNA-binding NtrC family response regulator